MNDDEAVVENLDLIVLALLQSIIDEKKAN